MYETWSSGTVPCPSPPTSWLLVAVCSPGPVAGRLTSSSPMTDEGHADHVERTTRRRHASVGETCGGGGDLPVRRVTAQRCVPTSVRMPPPTRCMDGLWPGGGVPSRRAQAVAPVCPRGGTPYVEVGAPSRRAGRTAAAAPSWLGWHKASCDSMGAPPRRGGLPCRRGRAAAAQSCGGLARSRCPPGEERAGLDEA